MKKYIYENQNWPHFFWNDHSISSLLSDTKYEKGLLLGKMQALGLSLQDNANLDIITENIIKSSEIEGEILNTKEVRSSIARKLAIIIPDNTDSKRDTESIVEMMLDAIGNYQEKLTKERLCGWNAALFLNGYSGLYKINAGQFRDDKKGVMQIVSGAIGQEKVHYEAVSADKLDYEMGLFMNWFNNDNTQDMLIKAAIAHLWFVSLHPFEDGNGRIARAITDMALSKSDNSDKRFYSMSLQIHKNRKSYYDILEKTQKGSLDISDWLIWFLNCLSDSIKNSSITLANILKKHQYLQQIIDYKLNPRQIKIIHALFDGFNGHLTSTKWAKLTKCSQDTANRDISTLLDKKLLIKQSAGPKTYYTLP